MYIKGGPDKRNVVCVYGGILLSCKKEGNPATCCDGVEPGGHDAEENESFTSGQMESVSSHVRHPQIVRS